MRDIRHSQFDKFLPWRWVTQPTVSFLVLLLHDGPRSGAESLHTSRCRRCRPDLCSHLIGLPGQIGVPTNSNNLDHGEPAERQTTMTTNSLLLDSRLPRLDEASTEVRAEPTGGAAEWSRSWRSGPEATAGRQSWDSWRFTGHDGWSLEWNSKNSRSSLRWERRCSPAAPGEKRQQQDVNNCTFFLSLQLQTFPPHFAFLNQSDSFTHQETAAPPHPPTHPLSEGWWWAQTPVGEKSVQKVSRMLFFYGPKLV